MPNRDWPRVITTRLPCCDSKRILPTATQSHRLNPREHRQAISGGDEDARHRPRNLRLRRSRSAGLRDLTRHLAVFFPFQPAALPVIGSQEVNCHACYRSRQPVPEQRPACVVGLGANSEPKASAEVTEQVAYAAAHQPHQRLRPRPPGGLHPFIQINLGSDEKKRKGKPVQGHPGEQPAWPIAGAQQEAADAKCQAGTEDPFQSPLRKKGG